MFSCASGKLSCACWNVVHVILETRRPRTSGIFSAPNLFEKDYWTTNLFLVDSFQHSNLRSLSKIWQNCIKNFENWKILGFLSFSVSIWYIFHLENSHYLFGRAYWTTNSCHSCHIKRFQHSNPRSLSKIWQKLHKNVKNRKILDFLNHFFVIFLLKNRIYLFRILLDNEFVPCWTFSTF